MGAGLFSSFALFYKVWSVRGVYRIAALTLNRTNMDPLMSQPARSASIMVGALGWEDKPRLSRSIAVIMFTFLFLFFFFFFSFCVCLLETSLSVRSDMWTCRANFYTRWQEKRIRHEQRWLRKSRTKIHFSRLWCAHQCLHTPCWLRHLLAFWLFVRVVCQSDNNWLIPFDRL